MLLHKAEEGLSVPKEKQCSSTEQPSPPGALLLQVTDTSGRAALMAVPEDYVG